MKLGRKTLTVFALVMSFYIGMFAPVALAASETVTEPVLNDNGEVIGEKTTTVVTDENGREVSREVVTVLSSVDNDSSGRVLTERTVTDGVKDNAPAPVENGNSENASIVSNEWNATANGEFGSTCTLAINSELFSEVPPAGYNETEVEGRYESPDGSSTWTSEEIVDEDGNVVGHKTTVTETEYSVENEEKLPDDMLEHFDELIVTEKEDGSKEYKLIQSYTLADGTKVKKTKIAASDGMKVTTTTAHTVIKETERVIKDEGSVTITVGSVAPSDDNGALTLQTITPDLSIAEGEGTDVGGSAIMYFINPGFVSYFRSMYASLLPENTVPNRLVYAKTTPYYLFGNFSSFIYTEGHEFEMQVLSDSEYNLHYAYCADRSVSANADKVFMMVNADDMYYLSDKPESVAAIKSIAKNGFWCTAENAGSLSSFRAWVLSLGYEGSLDALTPGVAEAVTQNAIWHYASSGTDGIPVLSADPVWVYSDQFSDPHKLTDSDINEYPEILAKLTLASELYQLIITKGDAGQLESADNTELMMNEDLIHPAVAVKSSEEELYNTDISFVIDIDADRFRGDVKVTAEYGEGLTKTGSISTNADGKLFCEVKDIALKSGDSVKINISGIQELVRAAYFLISETGDITETQTLVTIEEGERTVGFSFDVKVEIDDPETETTYREREETSSSSSSRWHFEEITEYEYPAATPPAPDPVPEPVLYNLVVTEEIYGEAPRTDEFTFVLEFSHPDVELPESFEVEGSRFQNGGRIVFSAVTNESADSAGTESGTPAMKAEFTLGHEQEIKIKGLPDGMKIKIVQTGGDERYETKIDGTLDPTRTAERAVEHADVRVDYANGYYSEPEPVPEPEPEPDPEPTPEPEPDPEPTPDPETDIEEPETPLDCAPDTGDDGVTVLWFALAAFCGAAAIALILPKRKNN